MSNLTFAPGETNISEARFSPSVVLFWLRTEMAVTSRRVVVRRPNTLLGLIPLGYSDEAYPLNNVASAGVTVKFSLARGIFGLIFFIGGISLLSQNAFGVILLLLGVSMLANALSAQIRLVNNGGGQNWIRVSVFQKSKLEQFRNEINHRLFADNESLRHNEVMGAHLTSAQFQQQQLQAIQNMGRPAPAEQQQQPVQQQPVQYQVGDVVNSHRFNGVSWDPLPGSPPAR